MCGIAVIFGKEHSVDEMGELIGRMTQTIRHRGPNDEGITVFPAGEKNIAIAAIGHRRLSIIDLSVAGHQPMSSADGRYQVTYNGEIYNYKELRKELEGLGYHFSTNTDTEVLLQAYSCWGVDCLHRFNGMFAFAVVDTHKQMIFAARDRFGIKPLYIWKSPRGTVALASEIQQFSVFPEWKAVINHQNAYDFLAWGMSDHREETFFLGVNQLLPGHYFHCSLQECPVIRKWYSIPAQDVEISFEEASSIFHDLFFDSVRLRMQADVEVGSCLSGGLDSSSIVCAVDHLIQIEELSCSRQNTFSACSHEKEYDERPYVDEVVRGRNFGKHYIYPRLEDLKKHVTELTKIQGEPFGSTSILAQWLIFKQVNDKGVRVMLDGQGADELLAGYPSFYGYRLLEQFKKVHWLQLIKDVSHIKYHQKHLSPCMMLINRLLPNSLRNPLAKALGKASTHPNWLDCSKLDASCVNPLRDVPINSVNDWGKVLATTSNLPTLLRYEDRNSMSHSVEARTPFLDYRIVEFCLNLPSEYKLHEGVTKKILRKSMSPYLPQKIKSRMDKMAFVTAEEKWMKEDPEFFLGLLKDSIVMSEGIIRSNVINRFHRMVANKEPFDYSFWRVISFGQWMKHLNVETK